MGLSFLVPFVGCLKRSQQHTKRPEADNVRGTPIETGRATDLKPHRVATRSQHEGRYNVNAVPQCRRGFLVVARRYAGPSARTSMNLVQKADTGCTTSAWLVWATSRRSWRRPLLAPCQLTGDRMQTPGARKLHMPEQAHSGEAPAFTI